MQICYGWYVFDIFFLKFIEMKHIMNGFCALVAVILNSLQWFAAYENFAKI